MRYLFFTLAVAAISLSACEKDYTCECHNPMLPTTQPATYYLNDKTHSQAKKACKKYEQQFAPGGTYNCALK